MSRLTERSSIFSAIYEPEEPTVPAWYVVAEVGVMFAAGVAFFVWLWVMGA